VVDLRDGRSHDLITPVSAVEPAKQVYSASAT
jgi:hypothetical protein